MFRYDRGNLVLTDYEYKILNILRPRVAGEEKFLGIVKNTYFTRTHYYSILRSVNE